MEDLGSTNLERRNINLYPQYYGDIVRRLFMMSGVLMLVFLPFFSNLLPGPLYVSIFAIVMIAIVAGLTDYHKRWTVVLDVFIAAFAVAVFEYFAVSFYAIGNKALFWVDQVL